MLSQYLFLGVAVVGLAFASSFVMTIRFGRALAVPGRQMRTDAHRRWASMTVAALIAFVLAAEAFADLGGMARSFDQPVFWVHLPSALLVAVLLFTLRMRYTGLASPRMHRVLIYWLLIPAFVVMCATGIVLFVPITGQLF
ncbi:MAG TPA: hypothetical protein VFL98_03465 [Candidatus Paceibacterota bacterium]|nr:hypothetical protein [Candidatus Paceibacterota bacterium]